LLMTARTEIPVLPLGYHAAAGRHEFLDILRRALPGRDNGLPAAGTVLLTVVLLALHFGFPRLGPPVPNMARLAPRLLTAGVLMTAAGPAGPDPMAALPLFEFALQLIQLRPQGGILPLLLLQLPVQLRILPFKFLDVGSPCHASRG